MKPHAPILTAGALALALTACEQGKPRHPPPDPMAIAPPAAPAAGAAQTVSTPGAPMTAGLIKLAPPAGFFLDHAGHAADPRTHQPASTPAGEPIVFDGFAFDGVAKLPGKGVDVVVDGQAYGAAYGVARPDVAKFFNAPALVNVGFKTVLPAGTLAPGAHTVAIRVVAPVGNGYFESVGVPFSVN